MRAKIIILAWVIFFFPAYICAQQRSLDFYIKNAKANSPFIHKNQNQKKLVQLDQEQLKSIYSKPEVTVVGAVLLAPIISRDSRPARFKLATKDANDYTGYDIAITDGNDYQGMLSVTQGLFNGKKLDTYANQADIQNRISDNNIELTDHELENTVRHQYILCLKSEKEAANSLALINEVQDELTTMQTLVESAIYKQSDLMLLQITRQNYQQDYETFMAEYQSNLYNLNLLCGIEDNPDVKLEDVQFRMNPEITTPSRFLTSFFLDSLAIDADLKISELKYQPQVSVFANAGMNAAYLPSVNRLGFSTGATFSLTIFDGNQRKTELQKSKINLETLQFEKEKTSVQNTIHKNYMVSQLSSLDKRISLADKQLDQYNQLLEVYKNQLSHAEISVMDYKYLLKDISGKKQEKLMLEMEKQIVINAYNYWNY